MIYPQHTAAAKKIVGCHVCHTTADVREHSRCPYCDAITHFRAPHRVQKSLAYLIAAAVLYLPANLLPIMTTTTLGRVEGHTIAEGVIVFWRAGDYPIAAVIFFASIVIPLTKMLSISWLSWFCLGTNRVNQIQLTRLYRLTELIGRWSMIDVFVVAFMVALVQMGTLMTVSPGPGATFFAGVVVLTMVSAHALDTRLLWDKSRL
jgi:paraquat-inducible protein A